MVLVCFVVNVEWSKFILCCVCKFVNVVEVMNDGLMKDIGY